MLLPRVEARFVPNLGTSIAGLLLLCLILFVIFLDRFLHRLRPVAAASLVSGGATSTQVMRRLRAMLHEQRDT